MTALSFPPSPDAGTVYEAPNNIIYIYDGQKWNVQGTTITSAASTNFVQDTVSEILTNVEGNGISFSYDTTSNTLTANPGKFVFDSDGDSAIINTTDDAGGKGGYDIVLVPGGEGNSSIRVPNQANSLAGFPLVIAATAANSAVKIETDLGNWTFGTNGIGSAISISLNPGPAVGYTTATNVPTNTNIGTGSGLTVDIVADGISISSVIINQPGQGYAVGDQLQIDQISSTGTGEITIEAVQGTSPVITLPYGHTIGSGSMDGIKLTTDRGTILLGNSPECVPTALTHFHVMKDDPSAVDLFFGDDLNYVKLPGSQETAYGVEIGTNDGSAQLWRFGTDGTTTFPRNTVDSGVNEISLKSHKYSELHWQGDQLISNVNAPLDNFVGVDDQGAYISTVGTEHANTWAFSNNGTLKFPDGTVQKTAYDSIPLDNIGLDGGSASVIYEVSKLFADGGSAGNRFGPNDPIFDGTGAGVVYGPSDLVLNGGVA
jgi:hypothetical protein